ncbi:MULTISPECIES: biotin transporter BioY [Corynebacterium]|nr:MULTISPECIES: biotin transporter BioY [Corynebacterium]QNP91444.1 biotin transporter BioY [Corynebacterium zhongnanshanii]
MTTHRTSSFSAVDLAYIAVFAALIIALGAVSIPVGSLGVPIVLQNVGPILAGLILGLRRGSLATILFLAVGLVGIPNLAGWRTTLSALPGPTVGYLVGYIVSALIVGWIAERVPTKSGVRFLWYLCAGAVGILVQYLCGSIGLVIRLDMPLVDAIASNGPFVFGGVVKIIAAAAITTAVVKAVPDLVPSVHTQPSQA